MATVQLPEANRRNSQLSPGPRTEQGMAGSRFQALPSGIHVPDLIIPGEDPADLEHLIADYYREHPPLAATERFLVDSLVNAEWDLRRLRKAAAQFWHHRIKDADKTSFGSGLDQECPLGQVFDRATETFHKLHRLLQAAERSHARALKDLQKLHRAAQTSPAKPQAAEELASFPPDPVPDPAPPPGPLPISFVPPEPQALWRKSTKPPAQPTDPLSPFAFLAPPPLGISPPPHGFKRR